MIQNGETRNTCHNVTMSQYQNVKMSKCQNVKMITWCCMVEVVCSLYRTSCNSFLMLFCWAAAAAAASGRPMLHFRIW